MADFELERDCDFRGYWVKGLKPVSDYCKKHTFVDDDEIFIPDKLIDILIQVKQRKK